MADRRSFPAAQHGCLVVNAPTANTVAAAEHGIALICALSRNVAQADASVKAGKWERTKYVGVSIVGKTLAVMGFGKVNRGPPFHYFGCFGCQKKCSLHSILGQSPLHLPGALDDRSK